MCSWGVLLRTALFREYPYMVYETDKPHKMYMRMQIVNRKDLRLALSLYLCPSTLVCISVFARIQIPKSIFEVRALSKNAYLERVGQVYTDALRSEPSVVGSPRLSLLPIIKGNLYITELVDMSIFKY